MTAYEQFSPLLANVDVSQPAFSVGNYDIISQQPSVISDPGVRKRVRNLYLPLFIAFWRDLEAVTGYRWKNTSYLRQSPSHQWGHAFDLAPDIAQTATAHYAANNGSDPVLYKRIPLIKALQRLRHRDYSGGRFKLGVFIEPDHLHVQVMDVRKGGRFPTNIATWRIPKPVYPDTYQRMQLPDIYQSLEQPT